MQKFNEETINESGEDLIEFCAINELRINNTFFEHPEQHKITWSNSRGQQSIIDYVLTNKIIHPTQILDVRVLSSANVGSDHGLVLTKIRWNITPIKRQPFYTEKFNVESLTNDSTRTLHQTRLKQKLEKKDPNPNDNVEQMWRKIKENITDAAKEAIGKRKVNRNKLKTATPWFDDEIKELAASKKKAFLRYKTKRTQDERKAYVRIRNETNQRIKQIKQNYWERYSKQMESDLYGAQKQIWRTIRSQKKEISETVTITNIQKKRMVETLPERLQ